MISLKFNKSDYKLITIFTITMVVWLSLKFYTENYELNQVLFDVPIIVFKTLAALFLIRWIAQKFFVERQQYALFTILSLLALVATGFLDLLRDYLGSGRTWSDLPSVDYIIIHSFYYSSADLAPPFLLIMIKKYFEKQTSLAIIKEQQKDAELKLLRSQLSPHFLFNNLNTVDALIDTDSQKAKTYIAHLSSLYRYFIKTKEDDVVPLAEELAMARDYFYLIETRFGKAYTFAIEEESALPLRSPNSHESHKSAFAKAYIPSGALQTIIENVVKHNKVSEGNSIHTTLTISDETVVLKNTRGEVYEKGIESTGV